jgi:hypothetical protein
MAIFCRQVEGQRATAFKQEKCGKLAGTGVIGNEKQFFGCEISVKTSKLAHRGRFQAQGASIQESESLFDCISQPTVEVW